MVDDPHDLSTKLDQVLARHDMFTDAEADTLRKLASVYESVSGFIRVSKTVAFVLAFIVVFWTQADRLRALMGGGQ